MKSWKKAAPVVALLTFCGTLSGPMVASATEVDSSIAACLKAWGDNPFGTSPKFKTLGTSVKVFGIGTTAVDTVATTAPELVLVRPIINVAGKSTVELLNPNGWYCLETTVSVIGRVALRVQCKAKLAMTSDGKTAVGNNAQNYAIRDAVLTSMGSVPVERPCD